MPISSESTVYFVSREQTIARLSSRFPAFDRGTAYSKRLNSFYRHESKKLLAQLERTLMAKQICELKKAGADGFVIGCLTADGTLDEAALAPLIEAAEGSALTLHRCIDISRNPHETYLHAAQLGFDTVLTSGAAHSCVAGLETIADLLQLKDRCNGPEVLIGAGVNAANIHHLLTALPHARAFHASCKEQIESNMRFRRCDVPMGLPNLDEWHIQQPSASQVRYLKEALRT